MGGWREHVEIIRVRESDSDLFISSVTIKNGKSVPHAPRFWKCRDCGDVTPDLKYGDRFMTQRQCDEALAALKAEPDQPPRKLQSTFSIERPTRTRVVTGKSLDGTSLEQMMWDAVPEDEKQQFRDGTHPLLKKKS